MMGTLKRVWDWILARSAWLRRLRSKLWYQYVSHKLQNAPVLFMNYGYAYLDEQRALDLHPDDEPHRTVAQFYHHIASAVDLTGKDVVEVGCGRGGGASFIRRYFRPRSVLGIDLAENAVEFCRRCHHVDGLCFEQGDAENLCLADQSADVVLNVESSHCYGNMDKFINEVKRVLRPGGHLLFADLGDRTRMARVRELFVQAGLQIVKEEKVNANVLKAMELDSAQKHELVKRFAPWFWRGAGEQFAGLKNSAIYQMLRFEETLYMHYVLQKQPV